MLFNVHVHVYACKYVYIHKFYIYIENILKVPIKIFTVFIPV